MDKQILDYCLSRKNSNDDFGPSWAQIAEEIYDRFGFEVTSVSGLRSAVSKYRRNQETLSRFVPGAGVVVPKSEEWGDGKAELVTPATYEDWEIILSISDLHIPWHNEWLLSSAAELAADINAHTIIFNGDVFDFFQLSRFNRSLDRLDTLQEEIDKGVEVFRLFRQKCPNAIIRFNLGNHDERILTYVEINSRSLSSLRALKPEELFGLNEVDIKLHGRNGFRLRPEFVVEHGHIVRKDAGASAKGRLMDSLISGMMGHTHRMSSYHKSGYRSLSWFEQGCMCLTSPDYVIGETNWQPGLAVGHFHTRKDIFNVELVRAMEDGFIYGGKVYGNINTQYGVMV